MASDGVLVRPQAKRTTGRTGGGGKTKKFELTEEQKQEIREAFDLFDTDGSGGYMVSGGDRI
jgi:Spy/CpxP family protein refolding chaperone